MQTTINLKAGKPLRQPGGGTCIVVLDVGAAGTLDNLNIEVEGGYGVEQYRTVRRGFRWRGPRFSALLFQASVDTTLEVVVTDADVSVNYEEGQDVNATVVNTVPVTAAQLPAGLVAGRLSVDASGATVPVAAAQLPAALVAGRLPVDASGATVMVSGQAAAGAAPVNPPLAISGVDDGGLKRHLHTDAAGNLRNWRLGCTITETIVPVTGVTAQVVAANAARKFLQWMVVGTQDVTVSRSGAAVMGQGMVYQGIGANKEGGSQAFEGAVATDAFQCIAAGAGSNLIVWEGV